MTSRLRRTSINGPMTPSPDGGLPHDAPLSPAALQRRMGTTHLGHRIYHYPEIGSTNDRAIELAAAGEPEGSIVIAEQQTQGRGRHDRTWISAGGLGLYLSMILRPGGEASGAPLFTLLGAVATARAISSACGCVAHIKWPNDVVVKGRKIAGVLGEVRSSSPILEELVLGIGVNVNHGTDDFPRELGDQATSMYLETGTRDQPGPSCLGADPARDPPPPPGRERFGRRGPDRHRTGRSVAARRWCGFDPPGGVRRNRRDRGAHRGGPWAIVTRRGPAVDPC